MGKAALIAGGLFAGTVALLSGISVAVWLPDFTEAVLSLLSRIDAALSTRQAAAGGGILLGLALATAVIAISNPTPLRATIAAAALWIAVGSALLTTGMTTHTSLSGSVAVNAPVREARTPDHSRHRDEPVRKGIAESRRTADPSTPIGTSPAESSSERLPPEATTATEATPVTPTDEPPAASPAPPAPPRTTTRIVSKSETSSESQSHSEVSGGEGGFSAAEGSASGEATSEVEFSGR